METMELKLKQRLSDLLVRSGRIEYDMRQEEGALPNDWEEQGVALENSEVLQALDGKTREEILQIHAALSRIAAGTFGRCSRCGQKVPDGRLQALPYTSVCVKCAG